MSYREEMARGPKRTGEQLYCEDCGAQLGQVKQYNYNTQEQEMVFRSWVDHDGYLFCLDCNVR